MINMKQLSFHKNKNLITIALLGILAIVASVSTITFAATNDSTTHGFSATYYNSYDLTGTSYTKIDPTINFNWRSGSPSPTLANNKFSTRWTGNLTFPTSTTWGIHTYSDDGVRVFINDQLVINDWTVHPPKKNSYYANFEANKTYKIKVEYYNNYVGASIKLAWNNAGLNEQIIPSSAVTPDTNTQSASAVPGFSATYFNSYDLTGTSYTKTDPTINFDWGSGSPSPTLANNKFSARWTGNLTFPVGGQWSLSTVSDDGVRLFVDDKLVINDWTVHPPKKNTFTGSFESNRSYKIKVEYYNNYVGASMKLLWSRSGLSEQIIPSSAVTSGATVTSPVPTTQSTSSTTSTAVTSPPTSTSPSSTQPQTNNCFANSIGVVSHPVNLTSSGSQKIWVRINSRSNTTLSFSLDSNGCIAQNIPSTNDVWTWVPINTSTSSLNSGSHNISVGSTAAGVKLSTLLIFNSSINCQPSGDGSNCPPSTTTTTQATTTTSRPVTTQPPATTPPSVTVPPVPGGGNADNLALEQFRNTDASYGRYANVPSSQLPLNVLTQKSNPDPSIFKYNAPNAGQFRTICEFSHLAYDDPIIKPMQPGSSHLHMFYGNTATNANSTPSSIANSGGSTCDGHELNRTAYWFPAVHDSQGRVRVPNGFVMYYKSEGVAKPAGGYTEMPQGLKIIAGNANATSPQQVQYNNGWGCGNMFINPDQALIPSCNSSTGIMLKVHFPRCWDGSFDFDPANPQAHVKYEVNGVCPATHSKVFTGMTALFDWDLAPGETTAGWYLSSDRMPGKVAQPGGTTIHGDWFGGWHTDVMRAWTQGCSNADWNCSVSFLGVNQNLPGVTPGGVNSLVRTTNKYDVMGPVTCVLPPRTGK